MFSLRNRYLYNFPFEFRQIYFCYKRFQLSFLIFNKLSKAQGHISENRRRNNDMQQPTNQDWPMPFKMSFQILIFSLGLNINIRNIKAYLCYQASHTIDLLIDVNTNRINLFLEFSRTSQKSSCLATSSHRASHSRKSSKS